MNFKSALKIPPSIKTCFSTKFTKPFDCPFPLNCRAVRVATVTRTPDRAASALNSSFSVPRGMVDVLYPSSQQKL